MRVMGLMYLNGRFATKNVGEGVRWILKAANAGDVGAMVTVAQAHENGRGGPKDVRKAVEWYRKAADVGDATAIEALRRLGK
jgi:hypothetical protein